MPIIETSQTSDSTLFGGSIGASITSMTLGVMVPGEEYLPAVIVPPTHKIEGKVFNYQGIPVARKVCVFSKTTDQFLGSMMSDSVTGDYSIQIDSADPCYIVCLPNESEDINAKIFDRIIPVAI